MERTEETLKARVRETPLLDRLNECRKRIGNMCAEGRAPRMCIPVQHDDDDFFICTTLADAQATVEALQKKYDDLLGKYRQLADFYDKHNGTPCEQIRHQQQVDYVRTLDATTPGPQTDEQRFIAACCECPDDCKWGGTGGCGYEGRKPKEATE